MTHNGTCENKKGKLHSVEWDYKDLVISDDYQSITIHGSCNKCNVEFQKTYSNPLLSIISKTSRETTNFNYMVDDIN